MEVKLHLIQIVLLGILILAVFFAGKETAITNSCPQPIINNFVDVNVITPPIIFDANALLNRDQNFSPTILVTVNQKDSKDSGEPGDTYITNNYLVDENEELETYALHLVAIDANGEVILDVEDDFDEGTPALVAMQELTQVEFTQYVYGAMIISIDGVAAGTQEYWALYRGDTYSDVGISAIVVNEPLELTWKIESW